MNNVYCFGDGYAHGHIWPEWPQLLEALLPDNNVITISGIGAGPEYLTTRFVELLPISGTVIFQWPTANRFDKLVEDDKWQNVITQDSVYHFNTYQHGNDLWWLSSASDQECITEYHQNYIQPKQAQCRLNVYQKLVQEILEKSNCPYIFTSTPEQDRYSRLQSKIRGTEIQPGPLSHWYFLTEYLMPQVNLHSDYILPLKELLIEQSWAPYDPDRVEIWQTIKDKLKTISHK